MRNVYTTGETPVVHFYTERAIVGPGEDVVDALSVFRELKNVPREATVQVCDWNEWGEVEYIFSWWEVEL